MNAENPKNPAREHAGLTVLAGVMFRLSSFSSRYL
jgi:hypothetical protein